jgi:hypothetical protein
MYLPLNVTQFAEDVLHAVSEPERRRVAVLAGLNVAAAALALGALHIGASLVHTTPSAPLVPATPPAAAQIVPTPHLPPAPPVAVPDMQTLFAPPVMEPTTFSGGQHGASASFTTASPPDPQPVPQQPATRPLSAAPPVARVIKLAEAGRSAADTALMQAAGPLMLTDAMLDAGSDVSASTGGNASASVSATVGSSVANVSSVASTAVTSVASSVGHTVSGIAGGLR